MWAAEKLVATGRDQIKIARGAVRPIRFILDSVLIKRHGAPGTLILKDRHGSALTQMYEFLERWALGESLDAEVGTMHPQQEPGRGCDGGCVVTNPGAVRGPDLA